MLSGGTWKVSKRRRFNSKLIEEDLFQETPTSLALLYDALSKLDTQPKQLINRNFHLFYSVTTNAIPVVLLCDSCSESEYDLSFTCFVNPPTKINNILRGDIIFLLDRSATMTSKPCTVLTNL